MSEVDESKFYYNYVPEHLKEKVKSHKNLSFSERFDPIAELSEAAWAKIGLSAIRAGRWIRPSGVFFARRIDAR